MGEESKNALLIPYFRNNHLNCKHIFKLDVLHQTITIKLYQTIDNHT